MPLLIRGTFLGRPRILPDSSPVRGMPTHFATHLRRFPEQAKMRRAWRVDPVLTLIGHLCCQVADHCRYSRYRWTTGPERESRAAMVFFFDFHMGSGRMDNQQMPKPSFLVPTIRKARRKGEISLECVWFRLQDQWACGGRALAGGGSSSCYASSPSLSM